MIALIDLNEESRRSSHKLTANRQRQERHLQRPEHSFNSYEGRYPICCWLGVRSLESHNCKAVTQGTTKRKWFKDVVKQRKNKPERKQNKECASIPFAVAA